MSKLVVKKIKYFLSRLYEKFYELAKNKLFPITRSLTGKGQRYTWYY